MNEEKLRAEVAEAVRKQREVIQRQADAQEELARATERLIRAKARLEGGGVREKPEEREKKEVGS